MQIRTAAQQHQQRTQAGSFQTMKYKAFAAKIQAL